MTAVTVIIPVYNGMNYIREAVESVCAQTFADWELLVVDDCSTDGLRDWIRRYENDSRIRYFRQEKNAGASEALNRGLAESRGEYVCWLSHDDRFLPDKLRQQFDFMKENPVYRISYTDWIRIDAAGKPQETVCSPWFPPEQFASALIYHKCFVNGSSVMILRDCFEQVGGFDPSFPYVADAEMWSRLLGHYAFGHVAEPLLEYRWHEDNQSHNCRKMRQYEKRFLQLMLDRFPLSVLAGNAGTASPDERAAAYESLGWVLSETWGQGLLGAALLRKSLSEKPSLKRVAKCLWALALREPRMLVHDWTTTLESKLRGRKG